MNIVLTTKDADSIIRWLREVLEDVSDLEDDISNNFKILCEKYESSKNLKKSKKCAIELEETKLAVEDRMDELKKDRLQILHFIELLTCGSEVSK